MARPEQERLDVLARRRLLEPADHRRLPAVLGGVQDRQRLAAGPVGTAAAPRGAGPARAARGARPSPARRPPRSRGRWAISSAYGFTVPGSAVGDRRFASSCPALRRSRDRSNGYSPFCSFRVSVATHRASATIASTAVLDSASSRSCRFSDRTYASFPCRPSAMSFIAAMRTAGSSLRPHSRRAWWKCLMFARTSSCSDSGSRSYSPITPLSPRTVRRCSSASSTAAAPARSPAAAPRARRRRPPRSSTARARGAGGRSSLDELSDGRGASLEETRRQGDRHRLTVPRPSPCPRIPLSRPLRYTLRPPIGAITMLTPAQVIPFLSHDDPEVRRLRPAVPRVGARPGPGDGGGLLGGGGQGAAGGGGGVPRPARARAADRGVAPPAARRTAQGRPGHRRLAPPDARTRRVRPAAAALGHDPGEPTRFRRSCASTSRPASTSPTSRPSRCGTG